MPSPSRKQPKSPAPARSGRGVKALFPGTFDPVTLGHVDLVRRAVSLFGQLVVGVAHNPDKRELLPVEARIELLRAALGGIEGVEVARLEGLVVQAAKRVGAGVIVRGVRNSLDFEYESQMARCNAQLEPSLQTVLLAASPEHAHISSTLVRQIILCGGNPSAFVPPVVTRRLARTR